MSWETDAGLVLPQTIRDQARSGLLQVAAWAARNQVRHQWPRWSANAGRFPYHVHLPTNDHFLSTSWNTARMVQGLFSAYLVFRDPDYLLAAEGGLEYIKSIQYF